MENVRGLLLDGAMQARYGEDYKELTELILQRAGRGHFDAEIHYPCTEYWNGFCRKIWTHCVTNLRLPFQMSYGWYGRVRPTMNNFDYITVRIWWD